MYKLIAIDLDGTLLDNDKKIPVENLTVLRQLIDKGYKVVIATGRRYWEAKNFINIINRPIIILANNGNVVRNTKDDRMIITKYLNVDDFKTLIAESKKLGLYPIIHVDDYENGIDLLVEMDKAHRMYHNYISKSEERCKEVEDYLEMTEDKILAVVYAGDKKDMESFHLHINERYPNTYSSHIMENIRIAEAMLEIMNPLGTKWQTLSEYAKRKGILKSEIIAIGDDNNDAEMVKNAGCGIAMKNASKSVKRVADFITEKDNNEAGVAFELKKILKV